MVWLARRIDPHDRSRAPGGVHWFWRQRVGGPATYVAAITSVVRPYGVPLVLEDGTILLVRDRASYLWIESDALVDANDPGAWHRVMTEERCKIYAG